jgi:hypothetical protein
MVIQQRITQALLLPLQLIYVGALCESAALQQPGSLWEEESERGREREGQRGTPGERGRGGEEAEAAQQQRERERTAVQQATGCSLVWAVRERTWSKGEASSSWLQIAMQPSQSRAL